MTHIFDTDIAKEYGVDIAIVVNNIAFWLQKNKANNKHIYEGKVWTYNSTKAFCELFPYWTENQIRRILDKMQDLEIIQSGNYNKVSYDRTKWYTFTDAFVEKHKSICEFCQMESADLPNGIGENHEPIPDIKPDVNNSDDKQYIYAEIIAYLNEKTSSRYRSTDSTKKLIHARMEEGFTKEDFFKVIDTKVNTWKGTEWEKYLRPETLFCASKFQGYLNEKPAEKRHAGSKEGYSVDLSKYETL